ncbi:MAG: hypothetical protein ACREV4_08535 [Gammaproteobacteria bacterium]
MTHITLQTADPTTQQLFDDLVGVLHPFFVTRSVELFEASRLLALIIRSLVIAPEADATEREITLEALVLSMRTEAPPLPQVCAACAAELLKRAESERFSGQLRLRCEHRCVACSITFEAGRPVAWCYTPMEREHAAIH